jgi:hypothetical protein
MHKGDEPNTLVDLLDADVLPGEDRAEVNLALAKADAATMGDRDGAVVQRVSELA